MSALERLLPQPCSFGVGKEDLLEMGTSKKDALKEICKKCYYSVILDCSG